MKVKKYRTRLIDEATYLIIRGLRYTTKKLGSASAIWYFDDTPELEKLRKQFYVGNPVININKWLLIRQELKHEQQRVDLELPEEKPKVVQGGDTYYYIDNNKILQSFFGASPIHKKRLDANNFFRTEIDAFIQLNKQNV